MFPLLLDQDEADSFPAVWRELPTEFVTCYRAQIERNHAQTLERLAERGGLSLFELAAGVAGRDLDYCYEIDTLDAIIVIQCAFSSWERTHTETTPTG